MSFAIMGAVIGAALMLPLGLPLYGMVLGFFFGVHARLTKDDTPDPSNWTPEMAGDPTYRRGDTLIAVIQIITMFLLAILGAGVVGAG